MATYVVENRADSDSEWVQVTTYPNYAEAADRLRREAVGTPSPDQLILLLAMRFKTRDGYEMRLVRVD